MRSRNRSKCTFCMWTSVCGAHPVSASLSEKAATHARSRFWTLSCSVDVSSIYMATRALNNRGLVIIVEITSPPALFLIVSMCALSFFLWHLEGVSLCHWFWVVWLWCALLQLSLCLVLCWAAWICWFIPLLCWCCLDFQSRVVLPVLTFLFILR